VGCSLKWMLLTGNESTGVYSFQPAAVSTYVGSMYRFAISVEQTVPGKNFTVSSGLVWSDCVYDVNKSKSVFMSATVLSVLLWCTWSSVRPTVFCCLQYYELSRWIFSLAMELPCFRGNLQKLIGERWLVQYLCKVICIFNSCQLSVLSKTPCQ